MENKVENQSILANKRIHIAGLGKRGLAFLIDFLIMGILSVILWNTAGQYIQVAMGSNEIVTEQREFAMDSGMCWEILGEEGEPNQAGFYLGSYAYAASMNTTTSGDTTIELGYGYELYLNLTYTSYTGFFANDPRMNQSVTVTEEGESVTYRASEYYTAYRFGVELLGLPNPSVITAEMALNEDNLDDESHYFKWALNEDGLPDPSLCPVATNAALDKLTDETLRGMRYVFYSYADNNYSGIYYDMYVTLVTQDYYVTHSNDAQFNYWASLAIFYIPLALIFFFIIPLCFRDGQTLGKKMLGLCLIGKDGYAINWVAHILHPLISTAIVVSAVAIPWNVLMAYIPMLMFMVLCVIDYMFGFLSKGENRMISDRLGMTYTIDARTSVWFASKAVEEDYEASHSTLRPKSGFFDEEISEEENLRYAQMDAILDLSTIDRHRKEAAAITSFDEFESKGVEVEEGLLEETQKQAEELESKRKNKDE